MNKLKLSIYSLPILLMVYACKSSIEDNNSLKYQPEKTETIKVILDTDMGSDCDDVGALALLNEYANEGKVDILGVIYSSGKVPFGAGIIDAINRYYGNSEIPIGADHENVVGDSVDKMLSEKLVKDTAAYGNQIIHNTDAPEQTSLLREILAEQLDNSVIYITIGHTKGLYDLLVSKPDSLSELSGMELVQKKIKKWVALGALHAYNQEGYYTKDWNFFFNNTAKYTQYIVKHFPKPSFFVSGGSKVMTGKSLINTPNGNIVRTAYRDWLWNVEKKTLNDQRPSWDLIAVLYALSPSSKYFSTLKGYLDFDSEKGCKWVESESNPLHHYVIQHQEFNEELANFLNERIASLDQNE